MAALGIATTWAGERKARMLRFSTIPLTQFSFQWILLSNQRARPRWRHFQTDRNRAGLVLLQNGWGLKMAKISKTKNKTKREWDEGLSALNRNAAGIDVGTADTCRARSQAGAKIRRLHGGPA